METRIQAAVFLAATSKSPSGGAFPSVSRVLARSVSPAKGDDRLLVVGEFRMGSFDDLKQTIRRNTLLGIWAAEKMGLTDKDAAAYSNALALGTLEHENGDVLSKIRKDFEAAGVIESEQEILRVMQDLTMQAGSQAPETRGATDAAAVMLVRKLKK
jgi:hypothetical protein